jgi:hypothetical protein
MKTEILFFLNKVTLKHNCKCERLIRSILKQYIYSFDVRVKKKEFMLFVHYHHYPGVAKSNSHI